MPQHSISGGFVSSFLAKHERLILSLLALAAITYFGYRYFENSAMEIDKKAQHDQQVVQQQALVNQQLQDKYTLLVSQIQDQNQKLATAISQRAQVTVIRQKEDAQLPPPELAQRWANLVEVSPTQITAGEQGLQVTQTAAIATVQKMETIPQMQQDLKDTREIAQNKDDQVRSLSSVNNGLNDQIDNLNIQVADKDKQCDARVDTAVKKTRGSRAKWFIFGFAAGVVAKLL